MIVYQRACQPLRGISVLLPMTQVGNMRQTGQIQKQGNYQFVLVPIIGHFLEQPVQARAGINAIVHVLQIYRNLQSFASRSIAVKNTYIWGMDEHAPIVCCPGYSQFWCMGNQVAC